MSNKVSNKLRDYEYGTTTILLTDVVHRKNLLTGRKCRYWFILTINNTINDKCGECRKQNSEQSVYVTVIVSKFYTINMSRPNKASSGNLPFLFGSAYSTAPVLK